LTYILVALSIPHGGEEGEQDCCKSFHGPKVENKTQGICDFGTENLMRGYVCDEDLCIQRLLARALRNRWKGGKHFSNHTRDQNLVFILHVSITKK